MRVAWLFVIACSKPATVAAPARPSSPALNKLMNEQVNPAFSRLSFLGFHADTQDDPEAARAELATTSRRFAAATAQVAAWADPPVQSAQGREVFQSYAVTLDRDARRLVEAIASGDDATTTSLLEGIAATCNNCHHFFRLEIKDSVVGH